MKIEALNAKYKIHREGFKYVVKFPAAIVTGNPAMPVLHCGITRFNKASSWLLKTYGPEIEFFPVRKYNFYWRSDFVNRSRRYWIYLRNDEDLLMFRLRFGAWENGR